MKKKNGKIKQQEYYQKNLDLKERQITLQVLAVALIVVNILIALTR